MKTCFDSSKISSKKFRPSSFAKMSSREEANPLYRVRQHEKLFKNFKKLTKTEKNWLKNNPTDCLVKLVSEICHNVKTGALPIKPNSLKKLKRHRGSIAAMAEGRRSLKSRRKVVMSGGFLVSLLSAAIPAILSYVLSNVK